MPRAAAPKESGPKQALPKTAAIAVVCAVAIALVATLLVVGSFGVAAPPAGSDASDVALVGSGLEAAVYRERGDDPNQIPPQARIVNGRATEPFEYPTLAGLVKKEDSTLDDTYCGATTIGDVWVLTAAHCVLPTFFDPATSPIEVLVGGWALSLELGRRHQVCGGAIHPDFVAPTLENDVAVIRLCEPHYFPTSPLPTSDAFGAPGHIGDVVGWGKLAAGGLPDAPHVASVTVQTEAICESFTALNRGPYDHAVQLCAGGTTDTCDGDSGGPLLQGNVVVAITSFGDDPCTREAPGVFVRVSSFVEWITEQTGIAPGITLPGVPCGAGFATHVGTPGNDEITTGDRGDTVVGFEGDDSIATGAGPDLVCAGPGDDTVLLGDGVYDAADGGPGNDTIYGQNGDDDLFGGAGNDKLRGGAAIDFIFGGDGDDDLSGGSDDDRVDGGDGVDTVRGGTGDDVVEGGPGHDDLVAGNGGRDSVSGGDGDDVLVTGGPRPDLVVGGGGNDLLKGNKGADRLRGEAGDDVMFGGPQPDSIDGGEGDDECNGGTTGQDAPEGDSVANCEESLNIP